MVYCSQAGGLTSEVLIDQNRQGDLVLHIYVDGSILEVFGDELQPISGRFYLRKVRELRV